MDSGSDRSYERGAGLSRRDLLAGAGTAVLAGGLAACTGNGSSAATDGSSPGATPRRGGNFRLGVTGGGAGDIIDGQTALSKPDQARLAASWETLLTYDESYRLTTGGLAQEVTQDAPDVWTIRLRDGVEFNNGKTLLADDVIYSLQRIVDAREGLYGATGLAAIDPATIRKLDDRTVRLPLRRPDSSIGDELAQYYNGIVPLGYSRRGPLKWVGTGPFITRSFTAGHQSVHVRNPHYWRSGQPYFDRVTITDYPESASQVNALLAGQLDAITDVPFAEVNVLRSNGGLAVLVAPSGGWMPLCMSVDAPPFTDHRVRQAMRLIVDRPAMLARVAAGYGRVANDLYAPFDACYDGSRPQREQDLEQARSLLRAAALAGATIDLHTAREPAGMLDSANAFAAQARGAGITVNVRTGQGGGRRRQPFSVSAWETRNYLPQAGYGSIPGAPSNDCHWPPASGRGSAYVGLYHAALAQTDAAKRCELVHAMQALEYRYGGYIIPFFASLVDSHSRRVAGFGVAKTGQNLDSFGHGYRTIWFTA